MKVSTKIWVIAGISLVLMAVNGCAISNKTPEKERADPQVVYQEKNQGVKPEPGVAGEPVTAGEPDEFQVSASDKIAGWKRLKATVSLNELTEHGSQPGTDKSECGFSIHFPGSWTVNSSVFYDADNKKVAELPPAVALQSGQEAVFLDYKPAINSDEEIVSKEAIEINGCRGSKTITTIPNESGIWHPHIYRLIDEKNGFTIIFYSKAINQETEALFEQIIDTFNFER